MEREVLCARINRRSGHDHERYKSDVLKLLHAGHLEVKRADQTWRVGDLGTDEDKNFLFGTIGYSDHEQRVDYDEEHNSWTKGLVNVVSGASIKAIVPFTIDLNESRRFVFYTTSPKIAEGTFLLGMERFLNAMLHLRGDEAWDVDKVGDRTNAAEWLRDNPNIVNLKISVKRDNPGIRIQEDLEEMRRLAATQKNKEYLSGGKRPLRLVNPDGSFDTVLQDALEGLPRGETSMLVKSRSSFGGAGRRRPLATYNSRSRTARYKVNDFGGNLELGIEFVLTVARQQSRTILE